MKILTEGLLSSKELKISNLTNINQVSTQIQILILLSYK